MSKDSASKQLQMCGILIAACLEILLTRFIHICRNFLLSYARLWREDERWTTIRIECSMLTVFQGNRGFALGCSLTVHFVKINVITIQLYFSSSAPSIIWNLPCPLPLPAWMFSHLYSNQRGHAQLSLGILVYPVSQFTFTSTLWFLTIYVVLNLIVVSPDTYE